ncbi:MAG: alpha-glucan phosphorylase [Omnitrophica bacterium RIFCSPHIGHO2_02_FULL_63_14]|nr:MAG: alpha-glucan phosphorylase [Omnitrophica bacterium RIFCSPHIGHO2_02_FULL_63_14]
MAVIAYYSMEIALRSDIPTYSGGLGVLAGDLLRTAADLQVPMVGVGLCYRKGHFRQRIDGEGWQQESPVAWTVEDHLRPAAPRVTVTIEGRTVHLRAWEYRFRGPKGSEVPVYLLDSDLPENAEADRALTHTLYGGDGRYRLCQEIILGLGGVRMLRALGHHDLRRFHMNEGHAGLLTLELLTERLRADTRRGLTAEDEAAVRQQCVFTTHTPVPAGHDRFPMDLVRKVLGPHPAFEALPQHYGGADGVLDLATVGLGMSGYVNGVARRHAEIARRLYGRPEIDWITNGVHLDTWAAPELQALFDQYVPHWRDDNLNLRHAMGIPLTELWMAHQAAKARLIQAVRQRTGVALKPEVLTLGFARRATPYKRAGLLFHDPERLKGLAAKAGGLQILYSGKAHPREQEGKAMIHQVVQAARALAPAVTVAYLEDYDLALGQLLTAGVDIWVNNPRPPLEASGTSGMKAAVNGVPSVSVLDGWWVEGHLEGVTGWAIGPFEPNPPESRDDAADAGRLYDVLTHKVVPLYAIDRHRFTEVMRSSIALNGSYFNTQRMLRQYVTNAYLG